MRTMLRQHYSHCSTFGEQISPQIQKQFTSIPIMDQTKCVNDWLFSEMYLASLLQVL